MACVQDNLPTLSEENEVELVQFSNLSLEQCFKNIIEGNSLEVNIANLEHILRKDLQLNLYLLKPKLKSIISYMLVHFIKTWPGWQRSSHYFSKQISYESWYTKFKKYLSYKLNYLVKNDFEKVVDMMKKNPPIDESVLFRIDNSTQTTVEKAEAPFSIQITGFPKMLNTLVFCEGTQGNILINEYKANPFDEKISTNQLINWPYIEIEFISKELHFKRKNFHEFKRYLTFSTEKIPFKKTEELIEEVEIIDSKINREAYTLNAMREYCKMYVNVLQKHKHQLAKQEGSTTGFTYQEVDDVKNILDNFVSDIAEINMNSIATNTSVLFNIGNCVYARNKSVRTSDQAVSFAEFVTPKINLSLFSFTAIKDANSVAPFEKLQEMNATSDINLIRNFLPKIKYNCTYCNKFYHDKKPILTHFKVKHCTEQPVLCFKCKCQLNVPTLAGNRWHHKCTTKIQSGPSWTFPEESLLTKNKYEGTWDMFQVTPQPEVSFYIPFLNCKT